jgi:AraC-like DNA-binding protein
VPAWTNATDRTATVAGVLRPEELARHVALHRWAPAPALDPWVENHWGLRWDLPAGRSHLSSVLPHPTGNLTVELGDLRAAAQGERVLVSGVVTRRFDTEVRGSGRVLGTRFRPGGFTSLTGVPAASLRDATVPARELLPAGVVAALAALGPDADPADDGARAALDAALAPLHRGPDPELDDVLAVVRTMLEDRSLVRVDQVEAHCGIGTRSLQRLFARYVGVGPKWVLARYRMHDVVSALDAGYDGTLADLAVAHGWYDQAHFTRDFTELVGVSPGAYRARR